MVSVKQLALTYKCVRHHGDGRVVTLGTTHSWTFVKFKGAIGLYLAAKCSFGPHGPPVLKHFFEAHRTARDERPRDER